MRQDRQTGFLKPEFLAVVNLVAAKTEIRAARLLDSGRGRDEIAHTRQLAMYLLHVVLGVTMTRTGELFKRDRTTVAHACARVEDRRDDRQFDQFVEELEQALAAHSVSPSTQPSARAAHLSREAA